MVGEQLEHINQETQNRNAMIIKNSKYLPSISIFLIDLAYLIIAPNIFQKGGVNQIHFTILLALIFISVLIYTFRFRIKRNLERILMVTIITLMSSMFSLTITYLYIQFKHSDKTWMLWENPDKLIANMVLFFSILLSVFGLSELYFKLKPKKKIIPYPLNTESY